MIPGEKKTKQIPKKFIKIPRETGKTIQNDPSLLTENFPVTRLFLKGVYKLSILMLSHL